MSVESSELNEIITEIERLKVSLESCTNPTEYHDLITRYSELLQRGKEIVQEVFRKAKDEGGSEHG